MSHLSRPQFLLIAILLFFSGTAALIYEVLWLKELSLLFGSTSQATAMTLTAFFMGLAAGGHYWGQKVVGSQNRLKLYAGLEVAVAVCAAGYFILLNAYGVIYAHLYTCCSDHSGLFLAIKFILALVILFPPAFFMGGTLPVISQWVSPHNAQLGQKVAVLYAVNTLGAVVGTLLAGFFLPVWLGYLYSYGAAMLLSISVAIVAFFCSGSDTFRHHQVGLFQNVKADFAGLKIIAFISGFLLLALQVLWGRMFAQVLQNSVYTFSLILIVFLIGLALAGFVARLIMQSRIDLAALLFWLLAGGALLVSLSPFVFMALTENLHYVNSASGWLDYLWQILLLAFQVMGPSLLILGCVFPLTIFLAEKKGSHAGIIVGQLVSINTVGAIFGSLLAGFVFLEYFGLWAGLRLTALLYFLTAGFWLQKLSISRPRMAWVPAMGIVLTVSVLDPGRLPVIAIDPINEEESLLAVWESSAGTVAVVKQRDNVKLNVNNYYTLGGTASAELEQLQGYLPVLLHTQPRTVYMLGLGTGISAGGALQYPIQQLIVTELMVDVVTAADTYFGKYTNGLFYDPRAKVLPEDGRHYLQATSVQFDVIISDLFVPWKAGTGSLYSLEHYRTVRQHLNENGLFMQWLPAYQLTKANFDVIARTMLAIFPQVTLWRADFSPLKPVLGLLGHTHRQALSTEAGLFKHDRVILLQHYIGDLTAISSQFSTAQLNTDNNPVIEFSAPIEQQSIKAGRQSWLAGDELIQLSEVLQQHQSAFLADIPEHLRSHPLAGFYLQRAQLLKYQGKLKAANQDLEMYRQLAKDKR